MKSITRIGISNLGEKMLEITSESDPVTSSFDIRLFDGPLPQKMNCFDIDGCPVWVVFIIVPETVHFLGTRTLKKKKEKAVRLRLAGVGGTKVRHWS